MKVYIEKESKPETCVVLYEDDESKNTPCAWVFNCDMIKCRQCPTQRRQCPALGVETYMTHAEVVEWWEQQEV
jgi:hypothetical protein